MGGKTMKIMMIGNVKIPFSTESDWVWTYRDLGHEVIEMQEDEDTTDRMWELGQTCDLIHYVHTHQWHTPGSFSIETLIQKFKDAGIVTIGYHLDYFYGLEREKDVNTHPWWTLDYIFTADGGSNDWYRAQGINHHYVKAGVVKRDCYIGNYREEYACDVAFVGSYHYHPEWPYRPRLIDWLQDTYGDRFRRYAGDTQWGTIRGSALNDLYASVKVVVGDTLCLGFNHPEYFSDRIMETTGRGGFLIMPFIEGIRDCFTEDELITYKFEDFSGLKEKIDYYLSHELERHSIQLAGHKRCLTDHSYSNRVREIFSILEKDGKLRGKSA